MLKDISSSLSRSIRADHAQTVSTTLEQLITIASAREMTSREPDERSVFCCGSARIVDIRKSSNSWIAGRATPRIASVPFNLCPPLGRRGPQQEVRDVTGLVAALRNRLAAERDGSSGETLRGQIAGAESHDPVTLPCDPAGGSRKFQAGFLAGHLYAHLIRVFGSLPGTFLVPAAAYAASLVSPQAERYLAEAPPQSLFRTHGYACLRVEGQTDLPKDLEFAAFRWLAVQLSVPVLPELGAWFTELQQRRHLLAAEREMERTS